MSSFTMSALPLGLFFFAFFVIDQPQFPWFNNERTERGRASFRLFLISEWNWDGTGTEIRDSWESASRVFDETHFLWEALGLKGICDHPFYVDSIDYMRKFTDDSVWLLPFQVRRNSEDIWEEENKRKSRRKRWRCSGANMLSNVWELTPYCSNQNNRQISYNVQRVEFSIWGQTSYDDNAAMGLSLVVSSSQILDTFAKWYYSTWIFWYRHYNILWR